MRNKTKIPRIKTIQPQWKRKNKIIFKAIFSEEKNSILEIEKILANTLGKMWLFA